MTDVDIRSLIESLEPQTVEVGENFFHIEVLQDHAITPHAASNMLAVSIARSIPALEAGFRIIKRSLTNRLL